MNGTVPPATELSSSAWQSPRAMAAFLNTGTPSILIKSLCGDFVEFEFTLGDPALALEMVMPAKVFQDFCQREVAMVSAPADAILTLRTSGRFDPEFAISPIALSQEPN